ncbi:MAG: leucine-rich repeat domain-containing protein [Candidatus Lokiarchaeia archaeon]
MNRNKGGTKNEEIIKLRNINRIEFHAGYWGNIMEWVYVDSQYEWCGYEKESTQWYRGPIDEDVLYSKLHPIAERFNIKLSEFDLVKTNISTLIESTASKIGTIKKKINNDKDLIINVYKTIDKRIIHVSEIIYNNKNHVDNDFIYRVNKHISLRLINNKTVIFINNTRFNHCKKLPLHISGSSVNDYDHFNSIDEIAHVIKDSTESILNVITPHEEFWGLCSNLHAWVENDYNTRLLHSNIAFPLLKELTKAGEPIARKVFKDEIADRFSSGFFPVMEFLLKEEYLSYFNVEEINTLLLNFDFNNVKTEFIFLLYNKLHRIGDKTTLQIIKKGVLKGVKIEQAKLLWELDKMLCDTIFGQHGNFTFKIKDKEVIELNINNSYKLESLTKSINSLSSLQKLTLNYNNNLKILSSSIGQLKFLKSLNLSFNWLDSLPEELNGLESLQILDLRNNRLQSIPESIGSLKSLQKLNLSENNLHNLPSSIGNLTMLKELILWHNKLKSLPESIGNLKSLEILYLGNNNLKILPDSIVNLTSLKDINFNWNKLNILTQHQKYWLVSLKNNNCKINTTYLKQPFCPQCGNLAECYCRDIGGVDYHDEFTLYCENCDFIERKYYSGGSPVSADWYNPCPYCGRYEYQHDKTPERLWMKTV